MIKYKYRLINKISEELDLRPYAKDIAKEVKTFGGINIRVYKRSYSFELNRSKTQPLSNGAKRRLGRRVAKIKGIGCYAYEYSYQYSNGTPGEAKWLFRIEPPLL